MAVDSGRSRFKDYMDTQRTIEFPSGNIKGERIWSRTWMPGLYNNSKKFLLLIGDAVSEGMSFYYDGFMGEEWTIHRQTGSISITDKLYMERLCFALSAARKSYNAICFTPSVSCEETPEEFQKALNEVIRKIEELQPEAKLVLAGLTLSNPLKAGKDKNIKIFGFNKALEIAAMENNAVFADLGALSQRIALDHTDDGVLFTDAGYQKLSFEAVKYIK